MESQGHISYKGQLKGHGGWVTSIATSKTNSNMLLTGSRDRSVIVWELEHDHTSDEYGYAKKRLDGHSNFVQDVQISHDSDYGLSASWDGTLRLWDLNKGTTTARLVGHTKDVMSCALSPMDRQIISGSRDKSIKMWNALGACKVNFEGHDDWVSCTRFSPNPDNALVVSCGWDKMVKVWSTSESTLQSDLAGHEGYVNTVTMSPDGSLCASGGKDGVAMLWDLHKGEHLYSLEGSEVIHELQFSPNRYWLCAATGSAIKIWDLESKQTVAELVPELREMGKRAMKPECISLAWSADGSTLFSGYTDNTIRVWGVRS